VQPGYSGIFLSPRQRKIKTDFQNACRVFFDSVKDIPYQFLFAKAMYPLVNLPVPSGMKVVLDADDVYFEVRKTRILKEKNPWLKLKFFLLYLNGYRFVQRLIKKMDATLVIKPSDKRFAGLENSGMVPNLPFGFFLQEAGNIINPPKNHHPIRFGFIGKMSYHPNHAGLNAFIRDIWNPMQEKGFNATLVVAGSGKVPAYLQETLNSAKNIKMLGFVEHIRDFWNDIDVLLSPVNEGGGTNIKIAEALMYGKRSIAHPFSTRGYDAFVQKNMVFVADRKEEWIQRCQELSMHNQYAPEELMKMANETYNVEAWKKNIVDFLQQRFPDNKSLTKSGN
jgi:hypothetical protein